MILRIVLDFPLGLSNTVLIPIAVQLRCQSSRSAYVLIFTLSKLYIGPTMSSAICTVNNILGTALSAFDNKRIRTHSRSYRIHIGANACTKSKWRYLISWMCSQNMRISIWKKIILPYIIFNICTLENCLCSYWRIRQQLIIWWNKVERHRVLPIRL